MFGIVEFNKAETPFRPRQVIEMPMALLWSRVFLINDEIGSPISLVK